MPHSAPDLKVLKQELGVDPTLPTLKREVWRQENDGGHKYVTGRVSGVLLTCATYTHPFRRGKVPGILPWMLCRENSPLSEGKAKPLGHEDKWFLSGVPQAS